MNITMTSRLATPGFRADTSANEQNSARRLLKLIALATLAGLLWLGAAIVYRDTCPGFGPATLFLPGQAPRAFAYPFEWRNPRPVTFVLVQQLWLLLVGALFAYRHRLALELGRAQNVTRSSTV